MERKKALEVTRDILNRESNCLLKQFFFTLTENSGHSKIFSCSQFIINFVFNSARIPKVGVSDADTNFSTFVNRSLPN